MFIFGDAKAHVLISCLAFDRAGWQIPVYRTVWPALISFLLIIKIAFHYLFFFPSQSSCRVSSLTTFAFRNGCPHPQPLGYSRCHSFSPVWLWTKRQFFVIQACLRAFHHLILQRPYLPNDFCRDHCLHHSLPSNLLFHIWYQDIYFGLHDYLHYHLVQRRIPNIRGKARLREGPV